MLKRGELCLSRFLSEYKITEFYNKISSNVGAKSYDVEGCDHNYMKMFKFCSNVIVLILLFLCAVMFNSSLMLCCLDYARLTTLISFCSCHFSVQANLF